MLPIVLCFSLDYAFSDRVDSDSDGITLLCSLWISRFFNNEHSVFISYRKLSIFLARGVLNVPLVKSFQVKLF